jgi:hypothetical protein
MIFSSSSETSPTCLFPAPSGKIAWDLDMKSLELLDHYTTVACLTLGTAKNMYAWQVAIPQIALSHDFVMYGILAVSALHLAMLQPHRKEELRHQASIVEVTALPRFRHFVELGAPQASHAVLAFAGFVVPYVLAQSGAVDAPLGRIPSWNDEHPHLFHAIRGLVQVLKRSWMSLIVGPFSPLLSRVISPVDKSRNPDDAQFIRIKELLKIGPNSSVEDKKVMLVCEDALEELRRVAALPYSPCKTLDPIAAIYIWPGLMPEEFLPLIYDRRPEALVILAHYCVLFKQVDSTWYFNGLGQKLLIAIDDELGEAWRLWIEWALKQPAI